MDKYNDKTYLAEDGVGHLKGEVLVGPEGRDGIPVPEFHLLF
jgi:hypothetical protein